MKPVQKRWFAMAVVFGGLLVPAAATLLVPIFAPERHVGVLQQLQHVGWTGWPFVILGVVGRSAMGKADLTERQRRQRAFGAYGALLLSAAAEFVIYVPQESYGMNFGIAFFPLYAAAIMPLGWLAGHCVEVLAHHGQPPNKPLQQTGANAPAAEQHDR